MAQGSLSESDTQLEIAQRLGNLEDSALSKVENAMQQVEKKLSGLT